MLSIAMEAPDEVRATPKFEAGVLTQLCTSEVTSTDTKSACCPAVKPPAGEPIPGVPPPPYTAVASVQALVTGDTDTLPPVVTFEIYRTRVARLIEASAGTLERSNCSKPVVAGDTNMVEAEPKLVLALVLSI